MANARVEEASRAVLLALDFRSSPEIRQAATAYLDSVKNGDVHALAEVGYALVGQQWAPEVRLYGFKMLQHLIRLRWEELKDPEEHMHLAQMSLKMIEQISTPHEQWALKSQAAALVAEVSRRGGEGMWKEMLPSLISLCTGNPANSELVAMVLRWLPEDVTIHNEDLEGERRRQLLFGLTQTLPQTLPFLFKLLEVHFSSTVTLAAQNQEELSKQHAAAVTAALFAITAFAEWAPVTSMVEYRLVEACSFLQQSPQFRLSACEVLKLLSARRKPADETGDRFFAAMMKIFEALAGASEAYLMNLAQSTASLADAMATSTLDVDEGDVEYGECLCEAMVALGSHNFQCVADNEAMVTIYLRRVLGFLQLPVYALHAQALPLWLTLLRDTHSTIPIGESGGANAQASVTETGAAGTHNAKEKTGVAYLLIARDYCAVLLELAYQRLLLKSNESKASKEDDFSTPIDYSQYNGRLLEMIRLLAAIQPLLAVSKVAQEIDANFVGDESTQPTPAILLTLESTRTMLEAVISGVPQTVLATQASSQTELRRLLEGIFERLCNITWKVPSLVELHGQHIEAMGPFLEYSQAGFIQHTIKKLFALLESLPVLRMDQVVDPASAKEISRARLQVCTSFLRVAKAADSALLPHAVDIATTMSELEAQGRLPRGEVNLLGETLLIVGSAGGSAQQGQVLDWLLAPLRECWEQPEWQQRFLSSPTGLVDMLSGNYRIFAGTAASDNKSTHEQIWLVFHTVAFLERAYRRCGEFKKHKSKPVQGSSVAEDMDSSSTGSSILVSHLSWMLPTLFKLLRCIHALWSDAIMPTLPTEVRGALNMGLAEQTSLLGTVSRGSAVASSSGESTSQMESSNGGVGTREYEIRSWLKGIRDSGYNVLGMAAVRLGDGFFDDADGRAAALATALIENIEHMEMHHLRQLVHSVIVFFVKSCPRPQWGSWLALLLPRLLVHCQHVLSTSWTMLIREGAVKPPIHWPATAVAGSNDGSSKSIKTEVILEKLLRDLTREMCNLLSIMAAPALSPRHQPAAEHQPGFESVSTIGPQSMLGFLMQYEEAGLAALHIGIEALEWPDSEAVHKATPFCAAVVSMASVLTEPKLLEIVGQVMFPAAIRGLTLESNATAQAELIGLLREIFIRLSAHSQAPRQLLLSLPSVTPEVLAAFEKALGKTSSVKEQRQLVKNLLLAAGGDQLKALKAQKNASVITNVTNRSLEGQRPGGTSQLVDPGPLGLASIF